MSGTPTNPIENAEAWEKFSDAELREKRTALKALVDNGNLMHRTVEREVAEIAIIDAVLEKRGAS